LAINSSLDTHILGRMAQTRTVSGTSATFPTQTFDRLRLEELLHVANAYGYDLTLEAGVLTLKPR
jgi:hypothetical protein